MVDPQRPSVGEAVLDVAALAQDQRQVQGKGLIDTLGNVGGWRSLRSDNGQPADVAETVAGQILLRVQAQ